MDFTLPALLLSLPLPLSVGALRGVRIGLGGKCDTRAGNGSTKEYGPPPCGYHFSRPSSPPPLGGRGLRKRPNAHPGHRNQERSSSRISLRARSMLSHLEAPCLDSPSVSHRVQTSRAVSTPPRRIHRSHAVRSDLL